MTPRGAPPPVCFADDALLRVSRLERTNRVQSRLNTPLDTSETHATCLLSNFAGQ
jgi:hypothetical protein